LIAVANYSDIMESKGVKVTPLKVWRPDIKSKKIVEVKPDGITCGSTGEGEEP